MNICELIDGIQGSDDKFGYACLKELENLSGKSNEVYAFMDKFIEMFSAESSYVRTRGLRLFALNTRWDDKGTAERAIDAYLEHITDEKPTTARQCIQHLSHIAKAKPSLRPKIGAALRAADFSKYRDSMSPLLNKDRDKILSGI